MVKLLSSHIALDSVYLYDPPRRAIYHYVSGTARVHDPLSKKITQDMEERVIRVLTVILIDVSSAQVIVSDKCFNSVLCIEMKDCENNIGGVAVATRRHDAMCRQG